MTIKQTGRFALAFCLGWALLELVVAFAPAANC